MADFAVAVVSKMAEYLVAPIWRPVGYIFHYNSNIQKMKSQAEQLNMEMVGLQEQIIRSRYNNEVIGDHVKRWEQDANEKKEEVDKFLEDQKEAGKGCWNDRGLNLRSRYHLSKKAMKETDDLMELVGRRRCFTNISHPPPPPGIVSSVAKGANRGSYVEFETRFSIMRDILEALKDDVIHVIGIWGMPGVGKTTMAKEIFEKARNKHLFDEVAMVVVSQLPDLKGIQESIAVFLGMNLVGEDLLARSHQLHERLSQEGQKRLIVLDDVWRRLDLDEIGIPCGENFMGCKIVLTSRDRDVCDQMNTDKDFHLMVLHEEEARCLFKRKVDYSSFHRDWRLIADGIVEECGGLPLAITAIATALVNKKEATWASVLSQLQVAGPEGPNAKVYEALRVSYDFLESDDIKKFFLLCCLFPEDSDIPIEDLLQYGVGRRLFEKTSDLHEARNQAYAHVEKLQNSNLLLVSKEGHVKMHDLVRDFAIWITSPGKHVKGWPWPLEDSYSGYTSISLELDGRHKLPNRLRCSNLELLRLVGGNNWFSSSVQLPEGFCEGMNDLQVLALGYMCKT